MIRSFKKFGSITVNSIRFRQKTSRFISKSIIKFNEDDSSDHSDKLKANSLVPQFGDNVPKINNIMLLPIVRRPIFPGFMSSVIIRNEKIISSLENDSSGYVGLFLRADKRTNLEEAEVVTDMTQVHKTGAFAQVQSIVKTPLGTQVVFIAHRRIDLRHIDSFGPPCMCTVQHWKKQERLEMNQSVKAYTNELVQAIRDLVAMNPLAHEHIQQWVSRIDLTDPYKLADFAAAMTTVEGEELQKVLECENVEQRMFLALTLVSKERELAKLQQEIKKQVEEKITEQQRKYFLQEQYKNIRHELGIDKDDKEELLGKYRERVASIQARPNVNSEVLKTIEEELEKLNSLEKNSSEFNVTRSYLDWLTTIPWKLFTEDRLNIQKARIVLDEDHYGMDEVKKRILEFIAVGKLKKTVKGKIICLIGSPGVGKTSIAKSIASALNRKFYRFSVGGLTDIAEIKGHRRTYIGAMPGKPIQCLKTTGCSNPLILIDEVDKLGRGYNGDPASALLELLDPNQNESFVDHYLDLPVDFSDALFVCTANDESAIPGPLKDRMEVIRLSGYDIPEKVAIASKYLVPKALREAGFGEEGSVTVEITEEALKALVKNYCRESGVRSLEKHIEKIVRKIAYDTVSIEENLSESTNLDSIQSDIKKEKKNVKVVAEDLESYVGKPRFPQETIYDAKDAALPVGIVMGLAWNPLGGSPIFIETAAIPTALNESGGGVNMITGQLGSVMKESVNIAYTFARRFVSELQPDNLFFKTHQLHLHVPEGAIEKDGPSAGIAMASSIISLSTGQPLRQHLAMTGEISLTGKVLPVGGIKEKILAARRTEADTVILPFANRRDFDELPTYVKESLSTHFVRDYSEVYEIAFSQNSNSSKHLNKV